MRSHAVVVSVEADGYKANVKPLFSSACIDCPSLCNRYEKEFQVRNKKGFPLKPGSFVKIEYSKLAKALNGTFALFFPMLMAGAGWLTSPWSTKLLQLPLTETKRFISSVIFLVAGEFVVWILTRTNLKLAQPEITQVV